MVVHSLNMTMFVKVSKMHAAEEQLLLRHNVVGFSGLDFKQLDIKQP